MKTPEYVPLDDMNKIICETDWELAINQILTPQNTFQSAISQVRFSFIYVVGSNLVRSKLFQIPLVCYIKKIMISILYTFLLMID